MTNFYTTIKNYILMAAVILFSSNSFAQTTVYDIIANSDVHETLELAIDTAQLDGALQDPTANLTVFAPTDEAFAALGTVVNDLLLDPTGALADILLYHVLDIEAPAGIVTNGFIIEPLNNSNSLKFTVISADGSIFVNQALVTIEDLTADNGIVHVIDAVLLPVETVVDVALDNDGFATLTAAVVAAELLPALTDPAGTFTVFAPNDAAFAALGTLVDDLLLDPTGPLRDILLYHVLGSEAPAAAVTNGLILEPLNNANSLKFTVTSADGDVFVNQAQVVLTDLGTDNGIVHVIDQVVLPVETVVDVALDNDGFATLTAAVVAAELLPALTDPAGTYTVFAPNDEAFAALGTLVDDLLLDPTGPLRDILLYHVLGSEAPASAVTNGLILEPLNNANSLKFTVTSADGDVFVNQAQVVLTDLGTDNGIVHVIDQVVLPVETVVDIALDNDGFATLTAAVVAAELLPALTDPAGTYTVFAPNDTAFAALGTLVDDLLLDPTGALRDILLYHVLDSEAPASAVTNGLILEPINEANSLKFTVTAADGDVFVNQAQVILTDLATDNGIVHAIDQVVLPVETVVDVALDNDGFATLTAAVVAAELLPALTDPAGTYTVFAPNDEAFAALGTLVDDLLLDPTGPLRDILLYHVLGSEAPASAVTNGLILEPLNNANSLKFTVTSADGDVFVNQAQVVLTDLDADNGIVHVIDEVVLPVETVVDVALDNDGFATLTAAVVAAELLPALTDPAGTYTVFAPNDAAFAALGTLVDDLLLDPTGALRDILLYHVLDSEAPASAVTNGLILEPINEANSLKFTVTAADGDVFVNQAQVVLIDLDADNGIVHAIDQVVLPVETVVDVALDNDGFATLTAAVVAAELLPALTDPAGTYTVFAPNDAAFAALGTLVDDLLLDPTGPLRDILLYHVLGTEAPASAVTNGLILEPLNNANSLKFTVTAADGDVFANQAQVVLTDLDADNGIVHVIDQVVLPIETVVDIAIDNDGFATLTAAVVAAELLPALTDPAGTYTVFAPNDAAFAALGTVLDDLLLDPTGPLRDILLYHVLDFEAAESDVSNGLIVDPLNDANSLKFTVTSAEGDVFVNQAQAISTDLGADNGIVHVIDQVVVPVETVVDVAIDNDGFSTLTAAVVAAELLPALTDPTGTYTVFAPTDDAFAELGTALNDLLLDPTGDLRDILLYHVLGTRVLSNQLENGDVETLLPSEFITVDLSNGVMINTATVVSPDNLAVNGVVHAIDEVLSFEEISTSIANEIFKELVFYPNPATNFININAVEDNYFYSITDIKGTTYLSGTLNSGINLIELSSLNNTGNYFIRIFDEKVSTTISFIKM